MDVEDEFKQKFFAAKTHIEKVQLCIRERRYKIWTRKEKPNLNGDEFVNPILNLSTQHPCNYKQRKSGGAGTQFVIDFKYSTEIMGATIEVYFKGFFGDDWTLKLEIQSLRNNEEK